MNTETSSASTTGASAPNTSIDSSSIDSPSARSNEVDIIRMAALVGICVVNVPFMALPTEAVFIAPATTADKAAAFFVECFFQLKFFILFSLVFGWGMAIQARSAASKGASFAQRYFRRMLGLAALGIAHAFLVFSGDILVLYAMLGVLLWLIRDYPPKKLLALAACMVPLSMALLTALALAIDAVMTEELLNANSEGPSLGGGFIEATQVRVADWPPTFAFLLLLQGPLAFAAFAVGLAAAKADFFTLNSAGFALLQKNLPLLLVVGLVLNVLYASVVGGIVPEHYELVSLLGFVGVAIGAPSLSLVYLYLFIRLARMINVPQLLVRAGQNSLSSYVTQGVLGGIVFGAYGLGLFGSLGHAELIPVSLMVALLAMVFVGGYAGVLGRGPLEPILRLISGR